MFKPGHLKIATGQITLGMILQAKGEYAQAETLLRDALESRIRSMSKGAIPIADARLALAECLARKGDHLEARALLDAAEAELVGHEAIPPALARDIQTVRDLLPSK